VATTKKTRPAQPKAKSGAAVKAATRAAPAPKPAKKVDLVREFRAAYTATREPALLVLEPATYLAVSGKGEPGGVEFQARVGALYGVTFTIKFARKAAGRDFRVAPLEGLYWGKGSEFKVEKPADWNWKLMVRVPGFVTRGDLTHAVQELREKGKDPAVALVKLERLREGECVQALHIGSYASEPETVARMQAFAAARGYALAGRHHEVYLSDPRRVPAPKIRTILRYPIARA
jgi:hypothetical protein